jgi:hypothetical protein
MLRRAVACYRFHTASLLARGTGRDSREQARGFKAVACYRFWSFYIR